MNTGNSTFLTSAAVERFTIIWKAATKFKYVKLDVVIVVWEAHVLRISGDVYYLQYKHMI